MTDESMAEVVFPVDEHQQYLFDLDCLNPGPKLIYCHAITMLMTRL
jgi:hypothetical protein